MADPSKRASTPSRCPPGSPPPPRRRIIPARSPACRHGLSLAITNASSASSAPRNAISSAEVPPRCECATSIVRGASPAAPGPRQRSRCSASRHRACVVDASSSICGRTVRACKCSPAPASTAMVMASSSQPNRTTRLPLACPAQRGRHPAMGFRNDRCARSAASEYRRQIRSMPKRCQYSLPKPDHLEQGIYSMLTNLASLGFATQAVAPLHRNAAGPAPRKASTRHQALRREQPQAHAHMSAVPADTARPTMALVPVAEPSDITPNSQPKISAVIAQSEPVRGQEGEQIALRANRAANQETAPANAALRGPGSRQHAQIPAWPTSITQAASSRSHRCGPADIAGAQPPQQDTHS